MTSLTLGPDVQALLQDAAEWRLISALLECPTEEWRHELGAMAGSE